MADVAPFKNLYKARKVAETEAKACHVCYKASNTVLVTLNQKDWFYCCPAHLKDTNFCRLVHEDDSGNSKQAELDALDAKKKQQEAKLKASKEKTEEEKKAKKELQTELDDTTKQITAFESYRKYVLADVFYKKRLVLEFKKQKEEKIQAALRNNTLFPSLKNLPDPK